MNREICLVVCFLLGMLIYHILKGVCGCDKIVEGGMWDGHQNEGDQCAMVGKGGLLKTGWCGTGLKCGSDNICHKTSEQTYIDYIKEHYKQCDNECLEPDGTCSQNKPGEFPAGPKCWRGCFSGEYIKSNLTERQRKIAGDIINDESCWSTIEDWKAGQGGSTGTGF